MKGLWIGIAVALLVLVFACVGLLAYLAQWPAVLPGIDTAALSVSAVPSHVEDLKSPEAAARAKAAAQLWQIGVDGKAATPALVQAAKDSDPQVRAAVVKA